MIRSLLIAGLLLTAAPAYAQEQAPGQGDFGFGAFFLTQAGGASLFTPGVSATFWATDQLTVQALLGLTAIENFDAQFLILGGADYYFLKSGSFGGYAGGYFGVNVNPIAPGGVGQGRDAQILFRLEAGGEYFASEHLGIFVSPGLSFNTEPTTFGFTTMGGARVYF